MPETQPQKNKRVVKIIKKLKEAYPDAKCALNYSSPFELLVATILSAQCTDQRVNRVTPGLFQKFSSVEEFARAKPAVVEGLIRSTGFYQNKTKSIIGAAKAIVAQFHGSVPGRMEDLVTLPGVGRKTANVVLGNAFDLPGLTVDTHMIRINNRLKLTRHKDPVKIEFELMKCVPKRDWTLYSHLIIHHGRSRCPARKPQCGQCEIENLCPSAGKI